MKKVILSILLVVMFIVTFSLTSCERCSQSLHSFGSNMSGLDRKVILYDYCGDTIQIWEGDLNVVSNRGTQEIYFDINGKRTIIYNGIVVVQEK